jgi:hypothetical protein
LLLFNDLAVYSVVKLANIQKICSKHMYLLMTVRVSQVKVTPVNELLQRVTLDYSKICRETIYLL